VDVPYIILSDYNLSSIVYAIQPKNGRPSIAEVMDGSFKKYASGNA